MTKKQTIRLIIAVSVLFLGFSSTAIITPTRAQAEDYILKQDTLIKGNFIVYDKKGSKVGELRPDTLIPDQYILILKKGTVKRLHFEVRNETDGN